MLAGAVAAFADYANPDENVLSTDYALNYKGDGDLVTGTCYGGCSKPWDHYAICFFGYEAIGSVSVEHGGGSGTFDTCSPGYEPETYIYAGPTPDDMTQYVYAKYGSDHNYHTETFSNIPSNCRYIKVRFQRTGSAACGSSEVSSVKASRSDSFSFYDGDTKLSDGATVELSTGVEKVLTINLYAVQHLTTNTKDVSLELVDTGEGNVAKYIIIDDLLFNDFSTDSSRSGCYNLNPSTATMKVNITASGDYSIYVNVNHDGFTIQRRSLNFHVSDTPN